MKRFLNRFNTSDKITILLKVLAVGTLALLMSSCASLDFRIATLNYAAQRQSLNVSSPIEVKTFTSNFDIFKNLDPQDLGLSFGGNWVHCRIHGFHDLNDWSDFTYSPYWCRPSDGFVRASMFNWSWGGYSYWNNQTWNPRFGYNYWGYTPHRWSPFGYDRWGYNNWMGNVYYGNYNWYRGRNVYRGRRATNSSGRWESTTPVRRVNRTTPTRTRTNVTPRSIRNNSTPIRVQPTRTRSIQNDIRPVRTPIRNSDVRPPMRTSTSPINNTPNNIRPVRTNTRTTTQPRRSKSTNVKKDNLK